MPARDSSHWQELNLLNLYRVFQASLFAALVLTPLVDLLHIRDAGLAHGTAMIYVAIALALWWVGRRRRTRFVSQVMAGSVVDLTVGAIALYALGGLNSGVGILLLVCVSMTSLLLPGRFAVFIAALASLAVLGEWLYSSAIDQAASRNALQAGLFGLSFFITVGLFYWLARKTRESEDLAERRGIDLANLDQLNELIIQRMRTGILVVDNDDRIRRMNEAAWYLMGMPSPSVRELPTLAPDLRDRLRYWGTTGKHVPTPLSLAPGVPSVVPRFTRLAQDDQAATLVFLDDESVVSRRAEELTLASLGRLSASIAHEVRNPLAAISHAAQLLAESPELPETDKRLIEIITHHCSRVNAIVENVLQLSRRERSRPEVVSLNRWTEDFVLEFKQSQALGDDVVRMVAVHKDVLALVDPSHLNQALWNLVRNALRHGRQPDRPAEVILRVRRENENGGPILEVIDRGPGIPAKVQAQLFEPFFTTRADGTGLGLYITRQLLEANQATIEFVNVPAGGTCFRIRLSTPPRSVSQTLARVPDGAAA